MTDILSPKETMDIFLDKVKRSFDKGVTTVSVKSKEMLETTQIRSQLKGLQNERQRGLEELGDIVYTLHLHGKLDETLDQVHDKCKTVAAVDERIREKEAEIAQVHTKAQQALNGVSLPSQGQCTCGAPLHVGAKFCGGCGKPIAPALVADSGQGQQNIQCPQCTAPLDASARFCGVCGAQIHAQAQEEPGDRARAVLGSCECGGELYEGTKFCAGCGKPVPLQPTGDSEGVAGRTNCAKCAAPLDAGVKFCSACGNPGSPA